MYLAKVIGNVVSTHKDKGVDDIKLLLAERFVPGQAGKGDAVVAMDAVGAGPGDIVLIVAGSSARMTQATTGRPCDATAMAIVDMVEEDGRIVYNKSGAP